MFINSPLFIQVIQMILISLLIGGCLLLYIIVNVYVYLERRKYCHFKSPPVRISPIWFLGVLPEYLSYTKKTKGLVFYEFHRVYGWDLFVIPIFTRNFIFCLDLGMLSTVCNDRITFPKSDGIRNILGSIAGTRIFGEHGLLKDPGSNLWQAKRRTIEPAFKKASLKMIVKDLNLITENLINRLQKNGSPNTVDITKEMCRTGFEAVSVCGFNWSQELLKKNGDDVLEQANIVINTISLAFREIATFNFPWSRRPEKRKLNKNLPILRRLVRTHLQDRMKNHSNGEDDIMSHIIRSNKCSDHLTIEDLVDEYLLFVFAGMDTTAIVMAITLFNLARYPEVLRKVQNEVDEVFGDKNELAFEDVNKLVYLEMVFKETMRLKPPATWTARQCKKDNVIISGHAIPKGAEIIVPIQAIHKDPFAWERPEEFIPERFSPEGRRNNTSVSHMPFMIGQRRCIGKNFAMLEMKTVVSRIVRDFRIENPDPHLREVETGGALTARPVNGVNLRLISRR